jgi:hypothetical protein
MKRAHFEEARDMKLPQRLLASDIYVKSRKVEAICGGIILSDSRKS